MRLPREGSKCGHRSALYTRLLLCAANDILTRCERCRSQSGRRPARINAGLHGCCDLLDVRLREDDASEQQVGQEQGPEDIDRLSADESERRPALLRCRELDESRLQPDSDKRQGEPPDAELAQRAAGAGHQIGRKQERENDRGDDEAEHELGEALPDDASARSLAGRGPWPSGSTRSPA